MGNDYTSIPVSTRVEILAFVAEILLLRRIEDRDIIRYLDNVVVEGEDIEILAPELVGK